MIRFVVRDATDLDWLPDWCVVDTELQVRIAAYSDEAAAYIDAAERNLKEKNDTQ